jgi:carboxymethylenebutenolidase
MNDFQRYLAEEIAEDHVDGLISRREALRRLVLLGLSMTAASSLIAAFADQAGATSGAARPNRGSAPAAAAQTPALLTEPITFRGPRRVDLLGAWAEAEEPRGGVLVIHENRGLNDHIRSVAGRLAASGYSALAIDLLSEERTRSPTPPRPRPPSARCRPSASPPT